MGKPYKPNSKIQFQGFFGASSTHVFAVESEYGLRKLKSIYLTLFDTESLEKLDVFDITPVETEHETYDPSEILTLGEEIVLISVAHNKTDKSRLLVAHKVSIEGKLSDVTILDTLYTGKPLQADFQIQTSKNGNELVVVQLFPFETFKNQKIKFTTFTNQLTLNWIKNLELPFKEKNMLLEQLYVDGQDNIIMLTRQLVGLPVDLPNQIQENNKYHIIGYNHKTQKVNEIELKLSEKLIRNVQLQVDDVRICVSGYYSSGNDLDIQGTFSLIVSLDYELIYASIQPFNFQDITIDKLRLSNLISLKLVAFESGRYALVGERQFKEVSPRYDARTDLTSYSDMFHYHEIIVSLMDTNGMVLNHIYLPKYQVTSNDQGIYSSVLIAYTPQALHLFYNDTERNMDLGLTQYDDYRGMTNYRKNYAVHVSLNQDGKLEKNALYRAEDKMNFRPAMAGQMNDGVIYLLGERIKQYRLLKVE